MQKVIKNNYVLFVFVAILFLSGCGAEPKSTLNGNNALNSPVAIQETSKATETVELTVSAAASLTDALQEIEKAYESKNKAVKLNVNFGASGSLQQQIEQGAPADLFLSAAPKNMKALVDKQLIDTNKQMTLLTNELVVVIPADGKTMIGNVKELTKTEIKHIAIGIPDSVPAGSYAKEALTNATLWDALQAKTVQAKDVRQVLQYVETGNADAGFVYKTDAFTSRHVKIAFTVDPETYTPVEYPIGIVKATKHSKEAEELYTYLQSKEALDVFTKYGFSMPKR